MAFWETMKPLFSGELGQEKLGDGLSMVDLDRHRVTESTVRIR